MRSDNRWPSRRLGLLRCTLKIWDLDSNCLLATLEGHEGRLSACAVALDSRRIVSASEDHTLKIWDLESGRALATLKGHSDRVNACAITPDGRCVVSVSDDRTIKVWDLASTWCLLTHRGDAAFQGVVATSGSIIAGDGVGIVWFLG